MAVLTNDCRNKTCNAGRSCECGLDLGDSVILCKDCERLNKRPAS